MPAAVREILALRENAGRSGKPFAMGDMAVLHVGEASWETGRYCLSGPPERLAEFLVGRAALGVTHVQVRLRSRDAGELVDQIASFAESVMPLVVAS
jgi:hypothetical protein